MNAAHAVLTALRAVRMTRASYDGRKGHNKKAATRAVRRLGRALAREGV